LALAAPAATAAETLVLTCQKCDELIVTGKGLPASEQVRVSGGGGKTGGGGGGGGVGGWAQRVARRGGASSTSPPTRMAPSPRRSPWTWASTRRSSRPCGSPTAARSWRRPTPASPPPASRRTPCPSPARTPRCWVAWDWPC